MRSILSLLLICVSTAALPMQPCAPDVKCLPPPDLVAAVYVALEICAMVDPENAAAYGREVEKMDSYPEAAEIKRMDIYPQLLANARTGVFPGLSDAERLNACHDLGHVVTVGRP